MNRDATKGFIVWQMKRKRNGLLSLWPKIHTFSTVQWGGQTTSYNVAVHHAWGWHGVAWGGMGWHGVAWQTCQAAAGGLRNCGTVSMRLVALCTDNEVQRYHVIIIYMYNKQ